MGPVAEQRIYNCNLSGRVGERVSVYGWVHVRRDHGKLIFIDLRDETALLQVVLRPEASELSRAKDLRPEWVVHVEGIVKERPKGTQNPDLVLGNIELVAEKLEVINEAATPPFEITVSDEQAMKVDEELRLKYRYLDLRRTDLRARLNVRAKVIQFARNFLLAKGFLEVETPLLTRSTPEGARDFLVPSRKQPGNFYALPQSPQQYKQLLVIGGVERYFQLARALRDEDTRGDRQPEHTQLDIEMAFVEQKDVMGLIEGLFTALVRELFPERVIAHTPFPHLVYDDAIKQYGTDRPDLRKDKNDSNELAFLWVTDFPMFERDEEGRWGAMHNPFGKPRVVTPQEMLDDPAKVRSEQYDLVLNGSEIAGGSIRAHDPAILEATFRVMGHERKEIQKQFGHMLEAFTYGAPPHGGIASGIDRVVAVLCGAPNIREVIAFPKTGDGRDPMMNTPAPASDEQLKELGLQLRDTKKK
ncbi:MAG: hypothetical protein A2806_00300 [Candidatus Terrybacteria bacterium RIFCSPHIGHO2_01_FULL_48_17]|uniref:Aspartate--tRNA(Asp/Asn) ligase n=1 Tax=Candidatus Terrybacteria bacterium RIFCSPHIGHO2_01_FULL_48_17 TaxID=1802362 RepID=A0A1G2PJW7_9BACT|nr:MAG: hypothetical protein A2806_00300 [Candidatus Terrybacteria bacterium RIFCSPHIGHO2_01_FULL_48_17]OHA53688.1 MAG: hypothetical protein A3A30_00620 [Candidatus Terrybacteria bacterium RIFCSPLOWO2_01_FULL_48_14]